MSPKPAHYAGLEIDVIDFCHANDIPFLEGNIIKYVCRWKQKGGLEDLHKALDYLQRLIARETKNAARS